MIIKYSDEYLAMEAEYKEHIRDIDKMIILTCQNSGMGEAETFRELQNNKYRNGVVNSFVDYTARQVPTYTIMQST